MNSFIPWMGGKKALRDEVVRRFPVGYKKYVEVFGGAAWVLFHKPPGRDYEVYNDFNSLLANLFFCVQTNPEELIDALRYSINSREYFNYIRDELAKVGPCPLGNVRYAAWFYELIRYSYAAGLTSFAAKPHDIWSGFPLIRQAHRRLRNVVVEHQSFEQLIPHFDSKETFFYCDPPYHNTEGYYQNIGEGGFTEQNHILLRDTLLGIDGKFLLSYNDDQFVRELYDRPGIHIEALTRLNNIKQRVEPNSQFPELLISNYDPGERQQIALF